MDIHLGKTTTESYYIPLKDINRSMAILGIQGSGKSNTTKYLISQIKKQGISVIVYDVSGEYRQYFKEEHILKPNEVSINLFDTFGFLSYTEIFNLVRDDLGRLLQESRKGSIQKTRFGEEIETYYYSSYYHAKTVPERTLGLFIQHFLENSKDSRLNDRLKEILINPSYNELFTHSSCKKLKDCFTKNTPLCIDLSGFDVKIRSVIIWYVTNIIYHKLKKEYSNLKFTDERPPQFFIVIEETADAIQGKEEVRLFEELFRNGRKYGLGFMMFVRTKANLKNLPNNILDEVGTLISHQLNEPLPTKNPALKQALKDTFGLKVGTCYIRNIKNEIAKVMVKDINNGGIK